MAQVVARTRDELSEDFLDLDRRNAALLEGSTYEQLTLSPGSGGWSVSQCIEHVARVNAVYLLAIKTAIVGNRKLAESNDQPLRTADRH